MSSINQTCYFHKNQPLVRFCIKKQCTLPLCSKCQAVHLKQHQKNGIEAQILSLQAAKEKAEKQLINFTSKQEQTKTEMITQIKNSKDRLLQMLKELFDQELEKVQKIFQNVANKKEQLKKISKGSLKNMIFYYGEQLPTISSKFSVENLLQQLERRAKKQYPQKQIKKVNSNPNHPMPEFLKSFKKSQDMTNINIDHQRGYTQKINNNNSSNEHMLHSERKKQTSPALKYMPVKHQLNGSLNPKQIRKQSNMDKLKNYDDVEQQYGYVPIEKRKANIFSSVNTPHNDKCPSFLLKNDHTIDDRDKQRSSNDYKMKTNLDSTCKVENHQRAPSSSKYKYQGEPQKQQLKTSVAPENRDRQENNARVYEKSPYKYNQTNHSLKVQQNNQKIEKNIETSEASKFNTFNASDKQQKIRQIRAFYEKQEGRSHTRSPNPRKQSLDKYKKYKYQLQASNHVELKKNITTNHEELNTKKYFQEVQPSQIQQKLLQNPSKLAQSTSQTLFQFGQKASLAQKYKNIKQKYQKNSQLQKQSSQSTGFKFPQRKIIADKEIHKKQQRPQGIEQNQYDDALTGNSIINQMYSPLRVQSK